MIDLALNGYFPIQSEHSTKGVMTLYVLIGLRFEERALQQQFGKDYTVYQSRVPTLIPALRFK